MVIDIIFLVIVIMAVIRGLRKGLIVAVFSIMAFIVGLAAALKLSAVVAVYLDTTVNLSARWLPVISFLLVFVVVMLLVRWGARLLENAVKALWMGWINKLGGVLFYLLAYTIIFSIFLFFARQVRLLSDTVIGQSVIYAWIEPWGPYVINGVGKIIPFFKDMFTQLESFFGRLSG